MSRTRSALPYALLIGLLGFLTFPCAVHASQTVSVEPNEAFALPFSFTALPNTLYGLKIRFSNDPKKCDPRCTGETWKTRWLKQSDDWTDHPTVTTDMQGKAQGFVIGRLPDGDAMPSFLQIAIRRVDITGASPEVLEQLTRIVTLRQGKTPVTFTPYDTAGQILSDGFISVLDAGEERFLPLFEGTASTLLADTTPVVRVLDTTGLPQSDFQVYSLIEQGFYRIKVNAPPNQTYQPRLLPPSSSVFVDQDVTLTLTTESPYIGPVQWFIDGVKQEKQSGLTLSTRFTTPGQRNISAFLSQSEEQTETTIMIQPYTDIRLSRLRPNPSGKDTDEEIVLKNNYPFPVTLNKWNLRSRTSSTKLSLSLTLPALGEGSIKTSNRLINKNGTYDLYSSDNRLIDTVSYAEAPEDGILSRNGVVWQFDRTATTHASVAESDTPVTVVGEVVRPRGRTIDIVNTDGENVHVVLHPSYIKEKPRLAKGDTIRVTGVWRVSRSGPYLSVRAEHVLILLNHPTPIARQKASRPAKPQPKLIAKAQAAPLTKQVIARPQPVHATSPPIPLFAPPLFLRWIFVACFTIGVVLLLPFPEEKTV